MPLITQRDFETKAGQEKIVKVIHSLEARLQELDQLVRECLQEEQRLESDIVGREEESL